jgi:hypothetical protein
MTTQANPITPGPETLHAADNRHAQAFRVAYFLEQHPESTSKEIDAFADTGCITKVLSDMPGMGYGISKAWRIVPCDHGNHFRQVRIYTLLQCPGKQLDLFKTAR